MREIERILNNCTECGICLNECDFLQKYCESPKELAVEYLKDKFADAPDIPYSCNVCTFCKFRCPEGIDIEKMIMEIRQELVEQGIGPLTHHTPIIETQEFYVSDEFKVTITSGDKTGCVFFPGCSLSAYSPDLVIKTYEYINELPRTGKCLDAVEGQLI